MFQPGTEWMIRALAAADEPNVEDGGEGGTRYCAGVADVLRLLVGDLPIETAPAALQDIYRRYQDAI